MVAARKTYSIWTSKPHYEDMADPYPGETAEEAVLAFALARWSQNGNLPHVVYVRSPEGEVSRWSVREQVTFTAVRHA
jgi:hypothetical protein